MIIVLLGEGCQISWDFDKLEINKNRSIFEWFLSVKFTDILYIINKLIIGDELCVTRQDIYRGNLFMDNTDIRTTHYTEDKMIDILKRRGARFIEQVKSDERILFVRYEHSEYRTSIEDILEFSRLIKEINPKCVYNLLLFANHGKTDLLEDLPKNVYHVLHNSDINVLRDYIKEFECS
jgi:hypothetical protein